MLHYNKTLMQLQHAGLLIVFISHVSFKVSSSGGDIAANPADVGIRLRVSGVYSLVFVEIGGIAETPRADLANEGLLTRVGSCVYHQAVSACVALAAVGAGVADPGHW